MFQTNFVDKADDLIVTDDLINSVIKVSNLSDISVSDKLRNDFMEILDLFSSISDIDVSDVSPSFHPIPISNPAFDDVVEDSLSSDDVLSNVVFHKDNFFVGPKILKNN